MDPRHGTTTLGWRTRALRPAGAAIVVLVAVSACTGSGTTATPAATAATALGSTASSSSPTAAPAAPSPATPTAAVSQPAKPSAIATAAAPTLVASIAGVGVTLYFETSDVPDASAQTELVTESGRHVYIDLLNTSAVARKPAADDVLLITHFHPDHEDASVVAAFPGKKLVGERGEISLPDVHITSLPAAHTDGDPMGDKDATDFIFVIDIGGVRVVHFGDLGEARLTADQMAAIGHADVAISQLQNPYSGIDEGSSIGFDQMRQVNPRIFIPTHLWASEVTARAAAKAWPALMTTKPSIHLTAKSLPAATTVLFMGLNAQQFGKVLKLKPAAW